MAKPIVSHSGYGIGKNDVRFMRVRRDGDRYYVTELWVSTELQLSTVGDYERGDNSGIVATDSQKNTVLVLAKQNEVCAWCITIRTSVPQCVCIVYHYTSVTSVCAWSLYRGVARGGLMVLKHPLSI